MARAAGVDATRQALRHTFATRLLQQMGVDLVVVSVLLGHAEPRMTARYVRFSGGTGAGRRAAVTIIPQV
jgi:site-specific recombinase XerD